MRWRITVDERFADKFDAQLVTFTLMNLLIRLDEFFPTTELILPATRRDAQLRLLDADDFATAMRDFCSPFHAAPRLTIAEGPGTVEPTQQTLISPRADPRALTVWGDGWQAYLNSTTGDAAGRNPIGPCVAAAFAAAELFKRMIDGIPLRPGVRVIAVDRLVFGAFDYLLEVGTKPRLGDSIDVGGVVLVGAGGIASATVFAASSLPALTGDIAIVDDDELDSTNLNRHMIARPGDRGLKVDLCKAALQFDPAVRAVPERIEAFFAREGEHHKLVVAAVDDDEVRRRVQATLPRVLLNAATGNRADMRVTRHDFLHDACLACIARAGLEGDQTTENLARRLGLPYADLLALVREQNAVPRELLQRSTVLSRADLDRFAGLTPDAIWQLIYNEAPLALAEEEAPSIGFLSALPGFLLLGEIIKEQTGGDARPPLSDKLNYLSLSVLGRPLTDLLRDRRQKRTDCDCGKPAWQRAYARKWSQAR